MVGGWRSFVSRGTIVSGLLSVLFWGLVLGWVAGTILVVLLYLHEVGHVLGARLRRMTIRGAPIFIPGLGAFVRVDPSANPWDDVIMTLGGPVVGGAVALAAGAAGAIWSLPTLAYAGLVGVGLNLFNLLPFAPLDGGRVVARTGWLGLLPTLLIGIPLLVALAFSRTGLLLAAIILFGIAWGYRAARAAQPLPRRTRLGIFGVYLTTGGLLLAALALAALPYAALSRSSLGQIWQGGPGTTADTVTGIAAEQDGGIVVTDASARRVRRLSPDGLVRAEWPIPDGSHGSSYPTSVAVDAAGDILVLDAANGQVLRFSPAGELRDRWGRYGDGPGEFIAPTGIAVDRFGTVSIAEPDTGEVLVFDPDGRFRARWTGVFAPAGIATDRQGLVYVADPEEGIVAVFDQSGAIRDTWDIGIDSFVEAVAVDAQGGVYVADEETQRIVHLSNQGAMLDSWPVPECEAATYLIVRGLAVTPDGSVHIAGWGCDRISKVAPDGRLLASWSFDFVSPPAGSVPVVPPRDRLYGPLLAGAGRLAWLPDPDWLVERGLLALGLLGGIAALAWRVALRPGRGPGARYLLLALGCGPWFLLVDPLVIPGLWCLVAQRCGLPGLRWCAAYARRLAALGRTAAGSLAGFGYDFARRSGEDADAWLAALEPAIRAAGPQAPAFTFNALLLTGYRTWSYGWLARMLAGVAPDALTWVGANNLAYSLLLADRAGEGLPYARSAVARSHHAIALGTLGALLAALGDYPQAEATLREALRAGEHFGNRLELARLLAAQGRYGEAILDAETALRAHRGPWLEDEPSVADVRELILAWVVAAAQGEAAAAPQPQLAY